MVTCFLNHCHLWSLFPLGSSPTLLSVSLVPTAVLQWPHQQQPRIPFAVCGFTVASVTMQEESCVTSIGVGRWVCGLLLPSIPVSQVVQRGRWLCVEGDLHEEWTLVCDEQGCRSRSGEKTLLPGTSAKRLFSGLGITQRSLTESLNSGLKEICFLGAETALEQP